MSLLPDPAVLPSSPGSAYLTPQLLVQQVADALSSKIFVHDPPNFGLASALTGSNVVRLQTRAGAGALALGYAFSPDTDTDPARAHLRLPQTVIAPSLALGHLRGALDQWALRYRAGGPLVVHVPAAAYDHGGDRSREDLLWADYDAALRAAGDLGLGLVTSAGPDEVQHMALLATLIAAILPTLHVYDGVRMARETLRLPGALDAAAVAAAFTKLSAGAGMAMEDDAARALDLFGRFNTELGTMYRPFEYRGHATAETVLVVLGSAEAHTAGQVAERLAADGTRVGVVNVRLYRPFIEDEFLRALPASTRRIGVLGQVRGRDAAIADDAVQSTLHADVLLTVSFADARGRIVSAAGAPAVTDVKYADAAALTPTAVRDILFRLDGRDDNDGNAPPLSLIGEDELRQFVLWDRDSSSTASSGAAVAAALAAADEDHHVCFRQGYDNLVQGGIVRVDIRTAATANASAYAPWAVDGAHVVAIGDESLLGDVDALADARPGSILLLKLAGFKDGGEGVAEKRLPPALRRVLVEKDVQLLVLDPSYSPAIEKDRTATKLLFELAFCSVARPELTPDDVARLVRVKGDNPTLSECADALSLCLQKIPTPRSWADDLDLIPVPATTPAPAPVPARRLVRSLQLNSFGPRERDHDDEEKTAAEQDRPADHGKDDRWETAAKGLVFKEAYSTRITLRPDLAVKTSAITVRENRRLTPAGHDRNIFHIEFDLGHSGLTYGIGEALGIHAENDEAEVAEFERLYGLGPDDLVVVPAREDPDGLREVRTVRQALVQNMDIFGRPPKRFYESLARFATDEAERGRLEALAGPDGADEFKRRSEIDTVTFADVLAEFPSARPPLADLGRMVGPLRRREYSIASAQAATPTSLALLIVEVTWVDPRGRTRRGHATRYLSRLQAGAAVTVSIKPSVMKLPASDAAPVIMAGLGTGLAPFRAFVQYRALRRAQGAAVGPMLLYLGSRHQREEYLYGEEWEAYLAAGIVTLLGAAFSRDQPSKIYIQDRMRETMADIVQAYVRDGGSFYLCGPTWPVPDVTAVLREAIEEEARGRGAGRVDAAREIEHLKEEGRYVLEVY